MDSSLQLRRPQVRPVERVVRRQAGILFALLLGVGYADQVSKAWAWRHLTDSHINSGGDMFVNPVVSGWFRSRVLGAAFDVADAALLVLAGLLLVRRHRPRFVLGFGALALAGWSSNLADRLLMHYWTAPGSVRGVVDFMPWDGRYWNVADAAIIVGTGGFVVASVFAGLHALTIPRRARLAARFAARRPLAGTWGRCTVGIALAAVTVLAIVGAIGYGGTDAPASLFAQPGR
jgi:lipoprotein signal peptidase